MIVRLDTTLKKIGSVVVVLVGRTTGSENRVDRLMRRGTSFPPFYVASLVCSPSLFYKRMLKEWI